MLRHRDKRESNKKIIKNNTQREEKDESRGEGGA
jgi:hypothetical protein